MARKIAVEIVGDSRSFERALGRASGSSSRFGAAAKRAGKIAAIGLGAGIGIAVVGLKKSFDAAKEAEVSQKKLEAQMRASGLSYRKFGGRIDEVIEKQSRLAAVDDEELQDSFTNILRVVPNVTRALHLNSLAAAISAARGMALAKAGELVGKVAGGNTGILSRYGIVLKKGATAQEALAALQKKFGGQAKAYGQSVAGAGDRVKVAFENVAETVGEMVFPLAGKVLSAFSDALVEVQKFVDKLGRAKGFKAKFNVVWTGVREQAQRIVEAIREAMGRVDWASLGKQISKHLTTRIRITADFLGNALTAMNDFIDAHLDEFAEVGAKLILAVLNKLLDPVFWAENWKLVLGVAIAVFPVTKLAGLGGKAALALLKPFERVIPGGIARTAMRAVDAVAHQFRRLPVLIQIAFRAAVSGAIAALGRLVAYIRGQVAGVLAKVPFWITAAFRLSFFMAFVNGIRSGWERVKAATAAAVNFLNRQWGRVSGPINAVIGVIRTVYDWLVRLTRRPWTIVLKIPRPSIPDPGGGVPFIPGVASGGDIARSGLAVVHRGERVLPARVVNRGKADGGGPGGEVRVIVLGGDRAAIEWLDAALMALSRSGWTGRGFQAAGSG